MRVRIEVEWRPADAMTDKPDDSTVYAHEQAKKYALMLASDLESYRGSARITEMGVER